MIRSNLRLLISIFIEKIGPGVFPYTIWLHRFKVERLGAEDQAASDRLFSTTPEKAGNQIGSHCICGCSVPTFVEVDRLCKGDH